MLSGAPAQNYERASEFRRNRLCCGFHDDSHVRAVTGCYYFFSPIDLDASNVPQSR